MTILLIDDSASVREVLRIALESEGYRVLEAAEGREGVRVYREHRPALTIVDIVMPEKDGIETVKEVLAVDPSEGNDCTRFSYGLAIRCTQPHPEAR